MIVWPNEGGSLGTMKLSIYSVARSGRIRVIAFLLIFACVGLVTYVRFIAVPNRQRVMQRYDEFRAVVATGDTPRIMQFIAPEYREWAATRLHLYELFAEPLDNHSTISVWFSEATICPKPDSLFVVIPGGHVIKMVEHNGEWLMGRVYID